MIGHAQRFNACKLSKRACYVGDYIAFRGGFKLFKAGYIGECYKGY